MDIVTVSTQVVMWYCVCVFGRKTEITYTQFNSIAPTCLYLLTSVCHLNANCLYICISYHWNVNRILGNEYCERNLNPIRNVLVNCGLHPYLYVHICVLYFLLIFIMTKNGFFNVLVVGQTPSKRRFFICSTSVHTCFTFNVSSNVWGRKKLKLCAWDTQRMTKPIRQSRAILIENSKSQPIIHFLSRNFNSQFFYISKWF